MTDTEPLELGLRLCSTFSQIVVRALLLLPTLRHSSGNLDHWRHCQYLPDLLSPKRSAPTCDLCSAIQEAYSKQIEAYQLEDEELQKGLGRTRIWIGTMPCRSLPAFRVRIDKGHCIL